MSSQSGSHTHVAGAVNNSAADCTGDDASKDNQKKKKIHGAAILFFIFIPFTADER